MKAARIVVLGVAVAAGGLAAVLAGRSHQTGPSKPVPAPVAPIETVDVLVAKQDLARGQLVDVQDIGWQLWPAAAANGQFIKKSVRPDALKQFVGAIVRISVAAGQPIYDPMVVFAKGSGFLAAVLPSGMRAVAMEITPVTGAGGFILPDDHVDVVLTRTELPSPQEGGVMKLVSNTILRNVTVLAVDQAVEEKKGEKAAVGKTATLEVTSQQAQMLALARQQGTLSLVLRSLQDSQSPIPESVVESRAPSTTINTVRFGVSGMATVER
ncbi:MAG: Flp pilus assembly protein CpaB [Xanthobacteraceae bacterium]